jgi:hypothetical protein
LTFLVNPEKSAAVFRPSQAASIPHPSEVPGEISHLNEGGKSGNIKNISGLNKKGEKKRGKGVKKK